MEATNFNEYSAGVLSQCLTVMGSKSQDYAENNNRYSNFEESAHIAGTSTPQAIITLIGIKVARLRQLTVNNKDANHESIDDSILDAINYLLILGGYKKGLQ